MAIIDPAPGAAAAAGTAGAPLGSAIMNGVRAAVSAGMSAQAIDQAKQASQGLKDAANSGQLRIEEGGFDDLMNAVNAGYTELATLRYNLQVVTDPPQLGTGPYAETVSAHVQQGGSGLTNSADAVVDQLGAVLDNIRDALNKAKQNYQDTEHGNAGALK